MTLARSSAMRVAGIGTVALFAAAGGLALRATAAMAAPPQTRYVATTGDDTNNDCTHQANPCEHVQHAVDQADPGDTVSIAAGSYAESVSVRKSLTFTGASRASVTVTGFDGDPGFEISGVDTAFPVAVTLQSLSVKHVADAPGVLANSADVTVKDSDIGDNDLSGVVASQGSVTTLNSTFDGNHGSPIENEIGGFGIVGEGAQLDVTRSTASDNDFGGIEALGGVVGEAVGPDQAGGPTLHVLRSTVAGNGAVGIAPFQMETTIDVSTVANNHGAGVYTAADSVTLHNSTVSRTKKNSADTRVLFSQAGLVEVPTGRAAQAIRKLNGGSVLDIARAIARQAGRQIAVKRVALAPEAPTTGYVVTGSIVAKNDSLPDCDASVTDGGYNLSSDAANSCGFAVAKHSLVQADPKLGPLADNGGPTKTLLPAKGSDAIDVIPAGSAGCSTKVTDQRSAQRPQPGGGKCDIGAVEAAQPPVVISPDSLPHGKVGKPYHAALSATGGLGAPYVFSLVAGNLPPGLSFGDDAVISGTPTKAGTYKITVSVDDPTEKDYTIVIEAAAQPTSPAPSSSSSSEPIANTGAPTARLSAFGATAVGVGVLLLLLSGFIGRRPGRHRTH